MNREQALKILNNEKLNPDELVELNWILTKHLYKERPVTIQEFYASDDYVHKKWPNIYPLWKQTLSELYPTPFNAPYNEVLISAAAGGGKCLGKGTEIKLLDGSIKRVEDIQELDILLGPDGKGRLVTSTCSGRELMYRITLQDGTNFTCNKSHIITLRHNTTYELKHFNVEDVYNNPEEYKDYYAIKYNDQILYKYTIQKLDINEYYGFTIQGDYESQINNIDRCFVLGNNIITHNTTTATIGVLYDMYKLGCLKDPCQFYNLTPGTMLIFAVFSATGSTAAVNWQDITTGIESCAWMNDQVVDRRGLEKKNGSLVPVEILPGIFIQTGSKFQHSMGKAIFDGLMDEAAFGGNNLKDAQKTYSELSSRMATRFRSYSKSGNLPGHLFLISSPKQAGDFMQYRIDIAEKSGSKFTKVLKNISSWDANPANDSDDKFTVFVGNDTAEPKILGENELPKVEDMDYLIYPPMSYFEEFNKDLIGSIMNYGGVTTVSDMGLFKSVTALNEAFVLSNPFNMDVIELPFAKHDKQLMDYCNLDYFKDIRHPEANRFIHIDAAFSSNTLDVYGLAAGYCTLVDRTSYTNAEMQMSPGQEVDKGDVFTQKDRLYFIDFAVGIGACKGQEVPLYKVQDFITYLIKNLGYPVATISADTFQSKQTLQNFETMGWETCNISVDRSRDPYLFLRHLVSNKQVLLPKNQYLKEELRRLKDNGKKVDHPVNCFTGDTKIRLLDGRDVTIEDLIREQQYKTNWVYTFNEQKQIIEPKRIKNIWQTKITKQLVRVTLDNGEVITCTPEHRFMLRDGSYEEIQNLKSGDSLMPLYTKVSDKGLKGYRLVYEPITDTWHYEHRHFVGELNKGWVVHHCNYNKLDNCPDNLKIVTRQEHTTIHNNQTRNYKQISDSVRKYHKENRNTEQYKARNEKISKIVSAHFKKVFESLPEDMKQKKLDKQQKYEKMVTYINAKFNVDYENLSHSQKCKYNNLYARETDPTYAERCYANLSNAHKQGKYKNAYEAVRQRMWVTNGVDNKYIIKTDPIPDGYYKGRTVSEEAKQNMKKNGFSSWSPEKQEAYRRKQQEQTGSRKWVTNGTVDKYISTGEEIPQGFYLGRCKVGKNHKIAKIEFITQPARVYDLEIEDNHNFALSSGIFVHNCHKDLSDAVAGAIWGCANSNNIMNRARVAQNMMNPLGSQNMVYAPEQSQALEMAEFERLKQQFKTSIFKGL